MLNAMQNRTCMMQSCDPCPGKTALKDYLTDLFSTNAFDMDDSTILLQNHSHHTYIQENLPQNTAIVLLDFAKNYSFLIQDAIQGFYWDNSQTTLHPFAIYHMEDRKIQCTNVVIISDCMKHDTATVHAFISRLISYVKEELPGHNKLI